MTKTLAVVLIAIGLTGQSAFAQELNRKVDDILTFNQYLLQSMTSADQAIKHSPNYKSRCYFAGRIASDFATMFSIASTQIPEEITDALGVTVTNEQGTLKSGGFKVFNETKATLNQLDELCKDVGFLDFGTKSEIYDELTQVRENLHLIFDAIRDLFSKALEDAVEVRP